MAVIVVDVGGVHYSIPNSDPVVDYIEDTSAAASESSALHASGV